ncbi:phosphoribosylformylglycinamidine cyclo-ligase [Nitrosomonas ureae]|uniref:Phosphoribosylformylglycinamidine cyclo-ligase n=1 Tax=Nitrosomonas ureae TaxID=44577 RepID=A0A1H5RJY8_9PROT|nr:phosphoribosylformylglycinamidine cyclo-ligase [Nitrosomonas ureae]SEF38675.1 phosphoribosylformylglycinamidine cyclo-ligase [Nitrosomonas ureae]
MIPSNSDHSDAKQLSYRDAGVDIEAGDRLVENIKPLAKRTLRPEVITGIGGFGALFEISKKYRNPVLVSGTDGVGTKLKLAFELERHDTIGIDLVAMSVNDILVQGAEPLFFLDYFACGKLNVETATAVVSGIAKGCELASCSLIGGETAEMPGMYPRDEYDLAGFSVGIVEKDQVINGSTIQDGDIVLGLASSGAHSNGYSLIRKIIEQNCIDLSSNLAGKTIADIIMAPTHIYVKPILKLIQQLPVKGLAHITGGGLIENIPRILPRGVIAVLHKNSWEMPPLFHWLQQQGNIAEYEMARVFNCGIGMVIVIAPENADSAIQSLSAEGETVWRIGEIKPRASNQASTVIV